MFLFTHPHALLLTSTAHPGLFLHALSIDTSADKLRLTLLQVHSITPTIPPDEQMNTHTSTQCIVSANEAAVYHSATVTLTRSSSCFTFFFSFFFSFICSAFSILAFARTHAHTKKQWWHSVDVSQAHCTVGETNRHTESFQCCHTRAHPLIITEFPVCVFLRLRSASTVRHDMHNVKRGSLFRVNNH